VLQLKVSKRLCYTHRRQVYIKTRSFLSIPTSISKVASRRSTRTGKHQDEYEARDIDKLSANTPCINATCRRICIGTTGLLQHYWHRWTNSFPSLCWYKFLDCNPNFSLDGTASTPCCGVGGTYTRKRPLLTDLECNVFCCACKHGCRQGTCTEDNYPNCGPT